MAIAPKSFAYEFDAATGVATVRLNRPERLNALTFDVYRELTDAFRALATEPGIRCVIVTGTGRGFCSGGDVEDIIGRLLGRDSKALYEFTRMTCDLILAIRECPRPVVAALNGTVAGAGAVIAAACDIRIAAESAKIAFLFVKVGLSGADMGAAWLLPRLVGFGRATEILMNGDFVPAREAERIGLYNLVVPDDQVMDEAKRMATKLAKGPSESLTKTKELLNREAGLDLRAALEVEAVEQAKLMERPDFKEAYDAFKGKREARFL